MKQTVINKMISLIMAVLLFVQAFPFYLLENVAAESSDAGISVENFVEYDYESLIVNLEDESVSEIEITEYEKLTLSADGIEEDAAYQWQIERADEAGTWVDIYDATTKELSVSAALIQNMLKDDNTASLRCIAETETVVYQSKSVVVTLIENTLLTPVSMFTLENTDDYGIMTVEETDTSTDTTPEFVTVTIEYVQYGYVLQDDNTYQEEELGLAFTSYVATLKSGTAFNNEEIKCPTVVGFDPSLASVTIGEVTRDPVITDDDTEEFKYIENDGYYVYPRQDSVNADVLYRVEYHPADVSYQVNYFFQNIYDDLYVEDSSIVTAVSATGKTGMHPDKSFTERKFEGFTSLYYEPETIAADGSTVFNVYYERNYYLMEFDCDGGYGTDTIYVRYGTYVSVPNSVRAGWVFNGWDLMSSSDVSGVSLTLREDSSGNMIPYQDTSDDGIDPIPYADGISNALPSVMPYFNTAYKAIWSQTDTKYSVAYWIETDDGVTFFKSVTKDAMSGTNVSGVDDICGTEAHLHSQTCCSEGLIEHTHHYFHSQSCYSSIIFETVLTSSSNVNDYNAIIASNNGSSPEDGTLYFIQAGSDATYDQYWPKMYINGNYYNVTVNGSNPISSTTLNQIVDGDEVNRATVNEYTAIKYKAKTSCDIELCENDCALTAHTHSSSCVSCGKSEHTHDSTCEIYEEDLDESEKTLDISYLVFSRADTNKTVEGDESTVVNVYYRYKRYTMRYYYAKTVTTQNDDGEDVETHYVVGGTTYPFGAYNSSTTESTPVLSLLKNVGDSEWGKVKSVPAIKDELKYKYSEGTLVDGNTKYYYLEFSSYFSSNIENLWPVDVFNAVEIDETHDQCSYDYAYFSAWNGEYRVKYTQDHSSSNNGNETIKGIRFYLDEDIVFDPRFKSEETYTDSNGENTCLVSFLCFWDNGANIYWSIPRLYNYYLWLETSEYTESDTIKTYNNKVYSLYKEFDVYDNSLVSENNHTIVYIDGYRCVNDDTNSNKNFKESDDDMDEYRVDFYYDKNIYTLKFKNHNDYLSDGSGVQLTYGTSLKKYGDYVNEEYMNEHYPSVLEPGAYEFAGWYTNDYFLPGTEVDWENLTMPSSDLEVYAYWKPVIRNVYFYYDYSDFVVAQTADDKNEYYWYHEENGVTVPNSYPILVEHGSLVGTTYSNIPEAKEGYTFVGWFYMDEDNKKRFAPDSMEVKRDLHLFAEWQSGIDTEYTVNYVLESAAEIGGEIKPAGTKIAETLTGHLTAGKTKTFNAKVGLELLNEYQSTSLFPTVNSHSILMEENPNKNTFEFKYVVDDEVWYRVRYINKITGVELAEAKVTTSKNAIITEKFKPIPNYLPENYYIRKVLASDGTSGSESNVNELNEIIFYYNPDENHGLYVIEYYTQVLGGSGELTDADSWYLEQSQLGIGDLNQNVSVSIDSNKFNGFSYFQTGVTTYDTTGVSTTALTNSTEINALVTQNGLEIKVYYKRNSYDYDIEFVEYGTGTVLGYGQLDDDGSIALNTDQTQVFAEQDNKKALFGSTIEYTAPDSIIKTVDGSLITYKFHETSEKKQNQSLVIKASNTETANGVTVQTQNLLTFYYQAKAVGIYYQAICKTSGATDYGNVSINYESAVTSANISGSNAIAGSGFAFVGWYTDEECTTSVNSAWITDQTRLKPGQLDASVDTVTYYALFEPITTSLTITKEIENLSDVTDTFVFNVQGNGKTDYINLNVAITANGSVTIDNLPIGNYIVSELTDWSWKYSNTPSWNYTDDSISEAIINEVSNVITVGQSGNKTITFVNSYLGSDWLNAEMKADNKFTRVYTAQ